jgi:hypothetical protein
MSAVLTYHVRAGQLGAVAAGKAFHLPTHKDPSRVVAWEKVQELRSGKYTLGPLLRTALSTRWPSPLAYRRHVGTDSHPESDSDW